VVVRLFVLWIAMLLVAMPADVVVELCTDAAAAHASLDEAEVPHAPFATRPGRPMLAMPSEVDAVPAGPTLGRVFRPPRARCA
jgi:hypothetical protein